MNIQPPTGGISLPFMKYKQRDTNERRLPGFEWLPNKFRNHFIAMMGEFSGTFLFLFFAFSATQVANAATSNTGSTTSGSISEVPNTSVLLYISLAFGFSLAVNAWVFFRISGGLFNPAVTLGMCLIGAVPWLRGLLVFISQILGSMAAAGVTSALFPGALNVSTTLGGSTSIVRGLFIEMFLTAELVFTIFMLAAEKHKGTFIAPIGIGLSLFIAELTGVYYTGGSLNPARSFGPCVVLHDFPGYHWIYWLGPALGSLLAVGFYRLIKILEYETANPGQDFNDKEAEVFNPDENPARAEDVARPNIALGRSEYVATSEGIVRSQDIRKDTGAPPRAPARYDGKGDSIAEEDQLSGDHHERPRTSDRASGDRFNAAPAAEDGTMGSHYRIPGDRSRAPAADDPSLGGSYRVSGL